MRLLTALALAIGLLAALPAGAAGQRDLGDMGWAEGFVVDAESGELLAGAEVELVLPADCEPLKNGRYQTTREGYFVLPAPCGRSTTTVNWGDVMNLSLLGALFGGGKTVTRYVEVSQLELAVSAPGYQTYRGPVPVLHGSTSPFGVWLNSVHLAPDGAAYRSYVDLGLPQPTLDIRFDNPVMQVGEVCTIKVSATNLSMSPNNAPGMICNVYPGGGSAMPFGTRTRQAPYEFEIAIGGRVPPQRPGVYEVRLAFNHTVSQLADVRFVAVGIPAEREAEAQAELDALAAIDSEDLAQRDAYLTHMRALEAMVAEHNPDYAAQLASLDTVVKALVAHDWEAANTAFQPLIRGGIGVEGKLGDIIVYGQQTAQNPVEGPRDRYEYNRDYLFASIDDAPEHARGPVHRPELRAALMAPGFPPPPAIPAGEEDPLLTARQALAADDPAAAAAALGRLNPKARESLDAQVVRARVALAHGDDATARRLFNQHLVQENAKEVKDFDAWYAQARLLLADGQWEQAEPVLNIMLGYGRERAYNVAAPRSPVFLPGGGVATLLTGPRRAGAVGFARPEAALARILLTYLPALADPASDPLSAAIGGRAMAEFGVSERALSITSAALAAEPDNEHIVAARAVTLALAGQTAAAREVATRLNSLNPRHPEAARLLELTLKP